jgi:hypothetical protein
MVNYLKRFPSISSDFFDFFSFSIIIAKARAHAIMEFARLRPTLGTRLPFERKEISPRLKPMSDKFQLVADSQDFTLPLSEDSI